jgi:microcystin-dependent protein
MSCSNCFNGCAEIVSDKCVRYTGDSIPALGIETGDTLARVEEVILDLLSEIITGTGVNVTIAEGVLCPVVEQYLPPCCGPFDVNEFITALIKAACDLQEQVDAVVADVAVIEGSYTVGCLTGVTSSSGTHAILQAVITKLCQIDVSLAALALDVDTNYVKLADLNSLIAAYLSSLSTGTQQYLKMVPYTVVEYYGALTGYPTVSDGFGGTGIGYGAWEKVYLCNGLNGTPDKRGRVPVGVTSGMGGGAFNPAVDPGIAGNPTYTIGSTAGANTVTLTSSELPAHTHTATASITDPGHRHDIWGITGGDNDDMSNTVRFAGGDKIQSETSFFFTNTQACQTSTTGISTAVTVAANTGGGGAHANNQPALACYYIMYIP